MELRNSLTIMSCTSQRVDRQVDIGSRRGFLPGGRVLAAESKKTGSASVTPRPPPLTVKLAWIHSESHTEPQVIIFAPQQELPNGKILKTKQGRPWSTSGLPVSLNGLAPSYLADDCQLVSDVCPRQLRSSDKI